jgi:hypothetical protein
MDSDAFLNWSESILKSWESISELKIEFFFLFHYSIYSAYTDNFLIYKEIQMGSGAQLYMTNGLLRYG